MSDLTDLYQELILDHNKHPRNYGELVDATHEAEGFNPLCGDQLHLYLKVRDGRIEDVRFTGSGCAISKSSASLMTTLVKGRTPAEAEALFRTFHELVSGDPAVPVSVDGLGKLAVFAGVREFPSRVKCASLAWHALKSALEGRREVAHTEEG